MPETIPEWLDPQAWIGIAAHATEQQIRAALHAEAPAEAELAALLSPAAADVLEPMAQRARILTQRHFGRTISLYIPLYLSDYCSGGCRYCGFASDRRISRHVMSLTEVAQEIAAIKRMGFEEVLLLTGDRTRQADLDYVLRCVELAARHFHRVTVEVFPLSIAEYRQLAEAGCTGVTLYQETYDPAQYTAMHRWGSKQNFGARVEAPARVLSAGIRTIGLGVLLGIAEPIADLIALFRHAEYLRRRFWQGGLTISFPRVCPQTGDFISPFLISEQRLAQFIYAFRVCLPDVPMVLSTREKPSFRDGIAGVGISKMSVASRTTVGGYRLHVASPDGQFHVNDQRDVQVFCDMLREKGLQPVFKDWEAIYH